MSPRSGRRALSGSRDCTVILWDVRRGIEIAAFVGDAPITDMAIGTDRIAAGSRNGAVHILELRE